MSRQLQGLLPTEQQLKGHPRLQFISHKLHKPELWRFNVDSVSKACLIGVFFCFMPVPFQMLLSAIFCVIFNGNMILGIALCWISNPITMPVMYYGCYKLGQWILNSPRLHIQHFSVDAIWTDFKLIWAPLTTGVMLSAIFFSILSFVLVKVFYKYLHKPKPIESNKHAQ